MSWGHVTSPDLLVWTRGSKRPVLLRDEEYDAAGVFTGCFLPVEKGAKELTVFYSSIRQLPFHWTTPPYPRDAAGLSAATSTDGGRTWQKSPHNPIIKGEPEDVQVSGFRDPYIAPWEVLDELRGTKEKMLYSIISGGMQDAGPTSFLYATTYDNIGEFEYLGPLVTPSARFQPSEHWSGNYGMNWECTNFMTLSNNATSKHFLILGAEGDVERKHVSEHPSPPGCPGRTVRAQLWMSGDVTCSKDDNDKEDIKISYKAGGFLDHGSYYAANSFHDPRTNRRVVYGWIPEEDATPEHAAVQGWNGALALPRELFLLTISSVTRALNSPLNEVTCFEVEAGEVEDGLKQLHTLGIRPIEELNQLQQSCHEFFESQPISLSSSTPTSAVSGRLTKPAWELQATIILTEKSCSSVGFHIRNTRSKRIRSTISFDLAKETIKVARNESVSTKNFNNCPEQGPFTLFYTRESGSKEEEVLEKLRLRIIFDGDVCEVFANDRFALATMVYSVDGPAQEYEVVAFAEDVMDGVRFEEAKMWDGLNGMKSLLIEDVATGNGI